MITARTSYRALLLDEQREAEATIRGALAGIRDMHAYQLEVAPDFDATTHRTCDVVIIGSGGIAALERAIAASAMSAILLAVQYDARVVERALALGASDCLLLSELTPALLACSIRHAAQSAALNEKLAASERTYRALFEHALDAILIADDDARYVDANPAALRLLGLTRDALLERRIVDLLADTPGSEEGFAAFRRAGRMEGEVAIRTASGERRIAEFRAVANALPGRHMSVLRDQTERHRAEEQRRRLEAVVEVADEAMAGTDTSGTISYWSPGAERLYGYAASEIVGGSDERLVPDHRRDELLALRRRVVGGETVRQLASTRLRKDGSQFHASVSMSPIKDGDRVTGVSVVTRDISDRAELQRRLSVNDRMVSVGILAAGIGHEINNPLAAAVMNLEMLDDELSTLASNDDVAAHALAPAREFLADSKLAADRIRTIVRDIKMFSRPDEERRDEIDVVQVIESAARMASNEIRHRARLIKELAEVPLVWGNDARLGQVVLNLLINAAQAIPLGNASQNRIRVVTHTENDRAVIEVHDTGSGIAPEHLERVFEPFFTTKPIGVGTGLGLSICQRIVDEMGGRMSVTSEVGRRTCVRVELPAARRSGGEVEPRTPEMVSSPARQGRVLVIDDDPLVLEAVSKILNREHEVTSVALASEAAQLIADGQRFDVILCDLMMPQVTGMELHEKLSVTAPDQAAAMVFVTGGAFTESAAAFLDGVTNPLVEKPFSPLHLRSVVRDRVA